MSSLRQEINKSMSPLQQPAADKASADFIFSPDFSAFNGHFPKNPLLPGICLVQCVLVLAQAWFQRPVQLEEIARAKFFAPVRPGDTITITCQHQTDPDNRTQLKATVTGQDQKISQLRLIVT